MARAAWAMPGSAGALAHCPHLMLHNVLDACEGTAVDDGEVALAPLNPAVLSTNI